MEKLNVRINSDIIYFSILVRTCKRKEKKKSFEIYIYIYIYIYRSSAIQLFMKNCIIYLLTIIFMNIITYHEDDWVWG